MNKKISGTFENTLIDRRTLLLSGIAATGLAAIGKFDVLGAAEAAANKQPSGKVVVALSQEPTVFHPLQVSIEVDSAVHRNIFSSLWRPTENGEFSPDLVEVVPTVENGGISADGLTWRLKLRNDVKWHDGAPFTAEDVAYTLSLLQNPKFNAGRRGGHELVTEVKVVSPTEIGLTLSKAYAPYLSILSWTFIVPKHILELEPDPNKTKFASAPIGSGPFKWESRTAGEQIVLSANPEYHGDGPYIEKLIIRYVPDLNVLFTQFQAGIIDYVGLKGLPVTHLAEARTLPDAQILLTPRGSIEMIALNMGLPIFKDQKVREALYYAIDKESIISQVYEGVPSATESFLPKETWAFNDNLPPHKYDPELANKLLDDAGWAPDSDGIRSRDGVRLEFSNSTTSGDAVRETLQQLIQQNWLAIGAKMTINNLPPAVMWGDFWMKSQFESGITGINFMTGPDPDASVVLSSTAIPAQGGSGYNTVQYSNTAADELLIKGATTFVQNERAEAYKKLQEIVRHDLPYLPLFQAQLVTGMKRGLGGVISNVNIPENTGEAHLWHWET